MIPTNTTTAVTGAVYRFNDSKIMYIAEKGVLRAIPDMTTFGGLQLDLDRIVLIPQSRKDYYVIGQPYLSTDLIDKLDSHTHKVKQQHKPQKSITPTLLGVMLFCGLLGVMIFCGLCYVNRVAAKVARLLL